MEFIGEESHTEQLLVLEQFRYGLNMEPVVFIFPVSSSLSSVILVVVGCEMGFRTASLEEK